MNIPDPGMLNISRTEYDALKDRENWSNLKLLDLSPAHYLDAKTNPPGDTDPKKRGRAGHAAVLEPEKYQKNFVVWGDRRAGKAWEAFKEEHESFGREIITEGMDESAKAMAKVVREHKRAKHYLLAGAGEHSLFWTYTAPALGAVEGYSFKCKARLDFVSMAPALVDYKTTKDASPEGFAREVIRYGYHRQAAWYTDAYHAVTGKFLPYVIIAQEATSPYATTVFRVGEAILNLGRSKYRELLDRLALCRATNHWPAYAEDEVDLVLPEWAMPEEDDDDPTGMGLVIGDANH